MSLIVYHHHSGSLRIGY